MEKVYMKGFLGPREWCSEKVNVKSYFDNYSQELEQIWSSRKKLSEIDILQHIVPQSNQLSEEQFNKLVDITNGAKLTELSNKHLEKKDEKSNEPVPSTSTGSTGVQFSRLEKEGFRKIQNRIYTETYASSRKEIIVDPTENVGRRDLIPKKHFIVSFRVHEPFLHKPQTKTDRPGNCTQQIWLLGHQKLSDLRDKIACATDYQDIRGDVSNYPDAPCLKTAKDLYPSSMFYIDNTFYIDERNYDNVDYSVTIKRWGEEHGLKLGETKTMEHATISELEVRFGYPYLFMHQGHCEHLIIINDAKLLTTRNSLYSSDYPLVTRVVKHNRTYCMTCSRFPARWIVKDCERLAHDPTFQCKDCFRMFHYVDGKKVGKFRAYLYQQRASIF